MFIMSRKEVYSATVEKIEVLDGDGSSDTELGEEELHELYRQMMVARKFDEKAFKLQRRGEISTYAPHKGQEAAQIGAIHALNEDDWMVPSFRETAAFIARGCSLTDLFQRWMGDVRGQSELENELPVAVPVGSQNLQTTGVGMAMDKKDEDKAVLGFTGDGSTSEGDFHEALNFAGVYDAHTVIMVQNNQYAISMPSNRQTNSKTFAQKGLAYGIDCIQVDGNDVLAVVETLNEALEKARKGEPVLVEAVTYRIEDHTTSDDSTRYRDEKEVEKWKKKDPIKRFREWLKENDYWNDKLEDFEEEAEEKVQEAAEEALEIEDPSIDAMFDYVYGEMPEMLKKRKEEFKEIEGE